MMNCVFVKDARIGLGVAWEKGQRGGNGQKGARKFGQQPVVFSYL
jgi:hypothetical protein